ncbi:hypothetical protein EG68_12367 [Paragonimus skrjabini miyazakii]|uniref:E2F-associated phosphoprotein n=1 Tax=Paragonimus skrjabini miyazakii TaxID=59628 RepID=A0A8S9YBK6_9TREM|nr:hypothetical protein EG68_12367 [Paragonimus skrjabini miyazakii]
MFACHYDGCDSDSELSSDACSQEEVDYIAYSKSEAQKFESIMNDELDAVVQDLMPYTREVGGGRKVHFHTSVSEHEDFRIVLSEKDELFYDDEEDDKNAEWVRENLPGGQNRNSHAVLNCPSCMTVLAVDCRRNSQNRTYYSSTYPINCAIDETSQLLPPDTKLNRNKKPKRDTSSVHGEKSDIESNSVSPVDRLFAVSCDICDARVGVKHMETGVVTFTNVLASHT